MVEIITKNLELEILNSQGVLQQAFEDMINAKVEGVVIRNLFTSVETSKIMSDCRDVVFSEINPLKGGTFPFSFAEINWAAPETWQNYVNECTKGRNRLKQLLGEGALGFLTSKLTNVFSNYSFTTAGQNTSIPFLPYTIRYTSPGEGHIRYHCENQSVAYFTAFFNRLAAYMEVYDMFSVFTPLQCGDSGGELSVYNEYWKGPETTEKQYEKLNNFDKAGLNPDKTIKKLSVALAPGDAILFNAGRVWHFVENVNGASPRITLGAFGGRSKLNAKELVLWS